MRLKCAPARGEVSVGAVVRATESGLWWVECFDPGNNQCRLQGSHCRLLEACRDRPYRLLLRCWTR